MSHGWGATGVLDRGLSSSIDELYAVAFAATIDGDLAVAAVHEGIAAAQVTASSRMPRRVDLIAAVLAYALNSAPPERPVPADLLQPSPPPIAADATEAVASAEDLVGIAMSLSVVLPAWDRAVLQLSLRHDIDGAELAEVLDRVPGTVGTDVQAARDHIEYLIGSALFAHLMRGKCAELDAAIDDMPAEPSAPELASRVHAHVATCAVCGDRRRGLVPMVNLLASVEVPPAPASLRYPVVTAPRRRTLRLPSVTLTWNRVLAAGLAALVVGLAIGGVLAATTRSTSREGQSATGGRLTTSVDELDFGTGRDRQPFTVHNASRSDITYRARAGVPWLSVSPASGSLGRGETMTLTVILDRSAAPEGANRAEVRISSGSSHNALVITKAVVERAPVIGTLMVTPPQLSAAACAAPSTADVAGRIVEEAGLASVQLHWRAGLQGEITAPMQEDKGVQRGTLGPFPAGNVVWWVTATDLRNNVATTPQQTLHVAAC